MITHENLQHWKNVAESLAKEIAEFENQQAAPVDDWPMTVEDLPENEKFWFVKDGEVEKNDGSWPNDIGDFATEKDAKSALAFAQLSRLIRHVNKGWDPDFEDTDEMKYYNSFDNNNRNIVTNVCSYMQTAPACLYFKNKRDAQKSIETWRQLWLDYFQVDETE